MEIKGKGMLIVDVNGTMNYFTYKTKEELKDMVDRFYKTQRLKGITIVDCDDKKIYWIDDDTDYGILMKEEF